MYLLKADKTQIFSVLTKANGTVVLQNKAIGTSIRVTNEQLSEFFIPVESQQQSQPTQPKKLTHNDDLYYKKLLHTPSTEAQAEAASPKTVLEAFTALTKCNHLFVSYSDTEVTCEICLHCKASYGIYNGVIGTKDSDLENYAKFITRVNEPPPPEVEHFPKGNLVKAVEAVSNVVILRR